MTTPAYAATPARVIRAGMRNAGWLEEGQNPNSEQLTENMLKLNDITNTLQVDGLRLWLQNDLTMMLSQGIATYILPVSSASRVLEGYFRDQNSADRPLTPISRNDYDTLSLKSQQGQLNSFFVDKQVAGCRVSVWLVPDAQATLGTMHLIVQQRQAGIINLTQDMVFSSEWFLGLSWALADEICTGQPAAIVSRCAAMWSKYKEKLDNWDVEDASTSFQPDPRGQFYNRGFR